MERFWLVGNGGWYGRGRVTLVGGLVVWEPSLGDLRARQSWAGSADCGCEQAKKHGLWSQGTAGELWVKLATNEVGVYRARQLHDLHDGVFGVTS